MSNDGKVFRFHLDAYLWSGLWPPIVDPIRSVYQNLTGYYGIYVASLYIFTDIG